MSEEKKLPENIRMITIILDMNSHQVSVSGAIGDKVQAYGMLAMAKEAIYEYHVKRQIEDAKTISQAERIIDT